jgi:hypothetical protein
MRVRAAVRAWLAVVASLAVGCHTPALPLARVAPLELDDTAVKLSVSRDGNRFVLGGGVHGVYLWEAPWGRPASIQIAGGQTAGGIVGAGFLDDGRVYAADSEHVEIWGPTLARRESQVTFPSDSNLSGKRVVVSPGGRFIAIDEAVLDVVSGRLSVPKFRHGYITAVVFAGDTHLLTAGFHDHSVVVRVLPSGSESTWDSPGPVVAAALTRDGALALVATKGGAYLWPPGSNEPRGHWGWSWEDIVDVCFVDDGRSAVVLAGRKLHVVDVVTLKEAPTVKLEADGTALACDGDLSAIGDDEGRVYVYDASRRQLFGYAGDLRRGVRAIAVSARARRVLALTNDEGRAQGVLLNVPNQRTSAAREWGSAK